MVYCNRLVLNPYSKRIFLILLYLNLLNTLNKNLF